MKSTHEFDSSVSIPFHSGWLEKKSKYIGVWRRRWVYLHGFNLYTFKETEAVYNYYGIAPHRRRYFNLNVVERATEIINLSSETKPVLIVNGLARAHSFQLIVHPLTIDERIVCFVAPSHLERQQWIHKLQSAIDIIDDQKLTITKVFRDTQNLYCYLVTPKTSSTFDCDDENTCYNLNSKSDEKRPLLQFRYEHAYQLSVRDINALCNGYINASSSHDSHLSCGLRRLIANYVRFDLDTSNGDVQVDGEPNDVDAYDVGSVQVYYIIGGSRYEWSSIHIADHTSVNVLYPCDLVCFGDCVVVNHSTLCLPEGSSSLTVHDRCHLDNMSNIKHCRFTQQNRLRIVCEHDMVFNASSVIANNLDIVVHSKLTMNASALIAKNIAVNVTAQNLHLMDSNVRCDDSLLFSVATGSFICDKTGIVCNNGNLLFCAKHGSIRINANDTFEGNIFAQQNIRMICHKFMFNAANKSHLDVFYPYIECSKGSIQIACKHRNLCTFNVYTRPGSNQRIDDYYWNAQQPQTWLTRPIPICYHHEQQLQFTPQIFEYKYSHPFQLSVAQIVDLVHYEMRQHVPIELVSLVLTQMVANYVRWDLVYGYNCEPLKTLYLQSDVPYEFYDVKINKGYTLMAVTRDGDDEDELNDAVYNLHIKCVHDFEVAGDVYLHRPLQRARVELAAVQSLQIPRAKPQPQKKDSIRLVVGHNLLMRSNSNISVNYYGAHCEWKQYVFNMFNTSGPVNTNALKHCKAGEIEIECNDLIMTNNCSVDSMGYDGGDIRITAKHIRLTHSGDDRGNVICSLGLGRNGGNIEIECDELDLSKNDAAMLSKIESIGAQQNGTVVMKAKYINGQISSIKPDETLTHSPATIILY